MRYISYLLFTALLFCNCYSFKGVDIPSDLERFDVPDIQIKSASVPPAIQNNLQDKLIQKISSESKLVYTVDKSDVIFDMQITEYSVESIAANRGNRSDANQLRVTVMVNYKNNKDEKSNWKQSFSEQRQFDAGINLLDVQDQLLEEIFDDMVDKIFNKAFTNW